MVWDVGVLLVHKPRAASLKGVNGMFARAWHGACADLGDLQAGSSAWYGHRAEVNYTDLW